MVGVQLTRYGLMSWRTLIGGLQWHVTQYETCWYLISGNEVKKSNATLPNSGLTQTSKSRSFCIKIVNFSFGPQNFIHLQFQFKILIFNMICSFSIVARGDLQVMFGWQERIEIRGKKFPISQNSCVWFNLKEGK